MTGFPGSTTGHKSARMKISVQPAALVLSAILTFVPLFARADDKPAAKVLFDIALDFDHGGTLDRALVVQDPASIYTALYIYLGDVGGAPDLSRKPSFVKKDLTTDPVTGLEKSRNGALTVKYGRVGLGSNQYEMRLTVVYRRGAFWVARFAKDWDMRDGSIGHCDINFLTGKGVASRGNGKPKPIKTKFKAFKLAGWSQDAQPKACR
jgi:hypothetical protein